MDEQPDDLEALLRSLLGNPKGAGQAYTHTVHLERDPADSAPKASSTRRSSVPRALMNP